MAVTFKSITRMTGTSAAVALCLAAFSTTASAQKTINLTAIDGYPPKAIWVKTFIEFFIPEVDRRLAKDGKYKIKWNQAWAGQIVKPRKVLQGLQRGLGDIGIVTSIFHPDKVPLQSIAFTAPFVSTDPALASHVLDELYAEFPAYGNAWKKYNQVYLTNLAVLDSYQMFFKEPVNGLEDFKGKKIASAGLNLRYLRNTGAAGVAGSLVSYYNKIKTGVVDGTMLWPEAVVGFKIVEVAPHMLKADIGTMNSKSITMNADSYNRLPKSVQKVIKDVAIAYRDYTTAQVMKKAETSYALFKKRGGKIVQMTQAQRMNWAKTMPNVAKDWTANLEKKGIPAKAVLKAYMDKMRAANQPILRHWDKE
jgi:TRAP-type C4-dicarboxylate transport system substrate-binding protein